MKTALITGASSGIGMELARIFAEKKNDLLIVARNGKKLDELRSEIEKKNGVKVHTLALDLSERDAALHVHSFCITNGITVEYLVNNAGFGDFGMFAESKWEKQQMMIDLNITALTQLTHLFLPEMIKRGSGKIMNVASTAAFQPGPLMSVYYATKAYVLFFSEAIANETKGTGVSVTALCPGPTESGFQTAADLTESKLVKGKKMPSSKVVADYGYRAMMKGKTVAIQGTMNYIMANAVRFTPRNLITKVVRMMQSK